MIISSAVKTENFHTFHQVMNVFHQRDNISLEVNLTCLITVSFFSGMGQGQEWVGAPEEMSLTVNISFISGSKIPSDIKPNFVQLTQD